jgi:hypothetical protein
MIQYSLLGRTTASTRLNTTFRGLALSPFSGKKLYLNQLTIKLAAVTIIYQQYLYQPIPVAAQSKEWVYGRLLGGIAGSNPAGGMGVCLS